MGARIRTLEGTYTVSVDEKGRTGAPKKVREVMGDRGAQNLVLVIDQDPQLNVVRAYMPEDWAAVLRRLTETTLSANADRVRRRLRASGEWCQVDRVGRLLIPPSHRQHLCLERKVVWTGQGSYAELYHPEAFEALMAMDPTDQAEGAAEIRNLLDV